MAGNGPGTDANTGGGTRFGDLSGAFGLITAAARVSRISLPALVTFFAGTAGGAFEGT